MTHPFSVVVRVASPLVLRCGSRRTFFLVQRLSGVVFERHEDELYASKGSWRELCRKPEVFFYERIQKFKGESDWVGLASFMGSLNLGEEQGKLSRHHTCPATLRAGKDSLQDRSHMRTLTYPVGHQLSTFTSTRQMVSGLRAAIEGLVFNLPSSNIILRSL